MKTENETTKKIDWLKLDTFTRAYIKCALWSSTDESTPSGGEPIDANYGIDDCTQALLRQTVEDCEAFQRDNAELLSQAGNSEQNGHDFWLTRNGHGAGFWDRGYPSEIGKPLSDAARVYGEVNLYVTGEGKIDSI